MKKKSIIFVVLTTILTFVISSCNDDTATYKAPTFSGITVTPNPCYEGDSITIVFNYADRGENWYFFKQTITLDGTSIYSAKKTSSSVTLSDPPTVSTIAPD